MKKVFLLMAAGSLTLASYAQELRKSSVVFDVNSSNKKGEVAQKAAVSNHRFTTPESLTGNRSGAGERTTTGGGRWYSYSAYFQFIEGTGNFSGTLWSLWNDSSAVFVFSDGTSEYNKWVSLGMTFDPFFTPFNDSTVYGGGMIAVSPSDAYTIDSVGIAGAYMRNNTGSGPDDNIRVGLVYGDGTDATNLSAYQFNDGGVSTAFPMPQYGVDTLTYIQMFYDATNNEASVNVPGGVSSPTVNTTNFPLHYTDSASNFYKAIPISTPMLVPPGNFAAASVTFKSGDPSFTFGSTVQNMDGSFNYGEFLPAIWFAGSITTPAFAPYSITNQNVGFSVELGANYQAGYYTPLWAWTTGGGTGGYYMQYPQIDFHVSCSSCRVMGFPVAVSNVNKTSISGVKTYPNPANDQVTIACTLTQSSNVSIVLSNLLGQVVATQNLTDVKEVAASFDTKSLPAGIYTFSLQTENGNHGTGRIVVAH